MSQDTPLIGPDSARYLAQVVNRVAASFDVTALSAEETIELYTLLDRLMEALWHEHKRVLVPFFEGLMLRLGLLEDDEPGEDEPEGSGPH